MGTSIAEFPQAFQSAIQQLMARCPGVTINSGFRTMDEQRALYNAYLAGQGNLAAAPGSSNHQDPNHGAVDIGGDKACAHRVAASLGLGFPVDGEDWHIELIGSATEQTQANNTNYVAQKENPLEVANRLLYGGVVFDMDDPEANKAAVTQQTTGQVPADEPASGLAAPQPGLVQSGGAVTPMPTILATLAAAGFSGDALVTAAAVVMAESGGIPNRPGPDIPPDGDLGQPLGWFQIREAFSQNGTGGWRDRAQLYDPAFNARAAFSISNGGTHWQPWEAYTNGNYQQYVDDARAALGQMGGVIPGPNARDLPALQDPNEPADPIQDFTDLTGMFSEPDISQFEKPLMPTLGSTDVAVQETKPEDLV